MPLERDARSNFGYRRLALEVVPSPGIPSPNRGQLAPRNVLQRGCSNSVDRLILNKRLGIQLLIRKGRMWHDQLVKKTRETSPPTFTAGQVVRILLGKVKNPTLIKWDNNGTFRPSFYFDETVAGCVITPEMRDAKVAASSRKRGAPPRLFTFTDLVYLRLLVEVSAMLGTHKVPNPSRRASEIVAVLRKRFPETAPSSSRLLVVGQDMYLLGERGAECLTGTQLPLIGLFTDDVAAELRGRIEVLSTRKDFSNVEDGAANAASG